KGGTMPQNRNMGRKSHHVQDAHFNQNIAGLDEEVGPQPTRPSAGKQQATKSSKEIPKKTK
ncbi:hypothetical protein KY385_00525, partial [Candidatus Parcubacteria bacterium]|nr:hypothetical protein [Candidatus Parcubacteria bacterium]